MEAFCVLLRGFLRPIEDRKRAGSAGPQEYAVFLLFQPVDTMHGFTPLNGKAKHIYTLTRTHTFLE